MNNLAIIGGGSWGTALAIVLAPRFELVRLWIHERDLAQRIRETGENVLYLPGFQIPKNVVIVTEFDAALSRAEMVLSVMPSRYVRGLFDGMLPFLTPEMRIVSATKGIENGTLLRISQVISQAVQARFPPRVAVLSGPTFALEVARGEPAAVVIAAEDGELASEIQAAFSSSTMRLYTNTDTIGVELGAALKNVIAIGAGVCQGLELGNNTMAALITRGLAEITRLAIAMGGQQKTLAGLAGLGDLVLTCTGDLSRNRRVGIELAKGRPINEILGSMKMVAEGVETCYAAVDLGRKYGIDLPITEQMYAVLRLGRPPQQAIRELMERSLKGE